MQEATNKQKRISLKTVHQMLDGMSVELAEKVHLLFMANYIDYSDYEFRPLWGQAPKLTSGAWP